MTDFPAALNSFLAALDAAGAKVNATMTSFPEGYYKPFTVEAGSKYLRIVSTAGGSRSVHCFVEKATGKVLKAEGWKKPSKLDRGISIFNPESYAKCDVYGGWLYLR